VNAAMEFALGLGGPKFLAFVATIESQAVADHVFPALGEVAAAAGSKDAARAIGRLCDRAFICGLYEAWKRGAS
jgi:hypothetical protein